MVTNLNHILPRNDQFLPTNYLPGAYNDVTLSDQRHYGLLLLHSAFCLLTKNEPS